MWIRSSWMLLSLLGPDDEKLSWKRCSSLWCNADRAGRSLCQWAELYVHASVRAREHEWLCLSEGVVLFSSISVYTLALLPQLHPPLLQALSRWGCKYHWHAGREEGYYGDLCVCVCLWVCFLIVWMLEPPLLVHLNSINLVRAVTSCKTVRGWRGRHE